MTKELRKFSVSVSAGRGNTLICGTYKAENPLEAIRMAKTEKARWASVELDAMECELTWEAEEDWF